MNTSKLFAICGLALFATNSYGGNCYHKIGARCKGGYISGYKSDCSTPCSTGVVDNTDKQQTKSNDVASSSKNETKKASVKDIENKQINNE